MGKLPVALQLYTLREKMESDFLGCLEKVAEIGYDGVEFAGFGEIKANKLKKYIDKLGLKAVGSHTPVNLLRDSLSEVIDYNLEIGNQYIVVPYMEYAGKDDFVNLAKELNEIGQVLKENNLLLCYHNHAHEFEAFDDGYGLDILYKRTSPDLLQAEIDTYWVKKAGLDPVEYVKKYADRLPLMHLKDMEAETGDFAEVGEGIIDTAGLIEQAEKIGTSWLIVEQDKCKRDPLESVKISYNNLKKIY